MCVFRCSYACAGIVSAPTPPPPNLTDATPVLDSDANMAITILLRYPQPRKDDPPRTFVQDAVKLQKSLKWETASEIIKEYTGRSPAQPTQQRPETPQDQTRTPERTLSPFKFPPHTRSPSGSIETIIQDAARGMYKTGEKWGVNKTIRGTIGDIRKNVQGMQSGRSTPSFRQFITGDAEKAAESTAFLQKIAALEERNKALAKMLEESVSELWECQKDALDGKGSDKKTIEALSLAIAKVQVMQVYLEDSSIPLPADDPDLQEKPAPKSTLAEVFVEPSIPSSEDSKETAEKATPTADKAADSAPTNNTATPMTTVPQSATTGGKDSGAGPSTSASSTIPPRSIAQAPRPRPSLASSSFSWMLGQEPNDGTPASSFAAASSLSTYQPVEKRERRRNKPAGGTHSKRPDGGHGGTDGSGNGAGGGDRAFLFGDTDDEFMAPVGGGGTGRRGKEMPKREVFDLEDVGGGNGSMTSSAHGGVD